jgi:hypothetical protein
MFWNYFIYNFKKLCYIYYSETTEQKEYYKEQINIFNKEKVKTEYRLAFNKQKKKKKKVNKTEKEVFNQMYKLKDLLEKS